MLDRQAQELAHLRRVPRLVAIEQENEAELSRVLHERADSRIGDVEVLRVRVQLDDLDAERRQAVEFGERIGAVERVDRRNGVEMPAAVGGDLDDLVVPLPRIGDLSLAGDQYESAGRDAGFLVELAQGVGPMGWLALEPSFSPRRMWAWASMMGPE